VVSLVRPIRSASISGYLELAKALGINGEAMMREVGLSPSIVGNIDNLVPIDAVCQLLEKSAEASGRSDFAIQLIAYRKFSNLGPIGLVLLDESTPRNALNTIIEYLQVLNPALRIYVDEYEEQIIIREELVGIRPHFERQSIELAIGVMFKILKELIGEHWLPVEINFEHTEPDDPKFHNAFFGCSVVFNGLFSGIRCRKDDLYVLRNVTKLGLSTYAKKFLEKALMLDTKNPSQTVKQLIEVLLPVGKCSASRIAELLGIDRRTLYRYLLAEGVSYGSLLNEVRRNFAIINLSSDEKKLSEVTKLLGFSGQSAFGYWFKMNFGESVAKWKNRN
jgi:AraC-like DNA-binding protein